jgi:hypothetical protein
MQREKTFFALASRIGEAAPHVNGNMRDGNMRDESRGN